MSFSEQTIPVQLEIAYLTRIQKDLEWIQLADEQKQNVRKEKLNWFLSKLYKNDRDQFIDYEESVVELYDEIINMIKILNDINNRTFLLDRLLSILLIEKELINNHNLIFKITHIDKQVIDNIFFLLRDNDIYEKVKVLEIAFQKMFELLPKEPYII